MTPLALALALVVLWPFPGATAVLTGAVVGTLTFRLLVPRETPP